MSATRVVRIGIACLFASSAPVTWAQVADPSDVSAVPRYTNPIVMVVSWTDNSNNESNFEIQRREVGGTFAFLGTAGANTGTFVDTTATDDRSWEYQVRARSATGGNSNFAGPTTRNSPRQVWPLPDGDHDLLHSYGSPLNFSGFQYFHDGVDISSSNQRVDAARGGVITAVNGGAGGTVSLNVDMGAGNIVSEDYLHITADPAIAVGDFLQPTDRVGTVRNNYFNRAVEADHVHWGSSLTNKLIPFTNSADRDPNGVRPVVADINGDGIDFYVVDASANNHAAQRTPAWGDVDFIVDAFDDMAASNNLMAAPFSLGYWIEPDVLGGGTVQSAATPYKLVQFDFALHSAAAAHADEMAAVYYTLNADIGGLNTWQTSFSWLVTNTNGTTGAKANMVATEFWRTDARVGSGAKQNRSDAARARENQEALFPDGRYNVHIVLNDLVGGTDAVRQVLVDNSRPYVKAVRVLSGEALAYSAQWQWNSAAAQLRMAPATFDLASAFPVGRTRDVVIEVEFSEPMQTASIVGITPLGVTPTMTSTQLEGRQTLWRGVISNIDIADDGSDDGPQTIEITGTDLAGNALLRVTDRIAMGADHHNRDGLGAMRGVAGTDVVHGFEIGALQGVQIVKAIFVRSGATAPPTPTISDRVAELQDFLNDYYSEVAYGRISFSVTGAGWYPLSRPLNDYYTTPLSPLVDLVQEAITSAEAAPVDLTATDFVLVVTDEAASRPEWSTNGGWPYNTTSGLRPLASGVLNLASTRPHVSNLAGRMIGLIDLFAYPEVIVSRPFVGPWSHMHDKDTEVHVLGWEKWRAGWVDETGTATGNRVSRVAKPPIASPIAGQTVTLTPTNTDTNDTKVLAIDIGPDLHYIAEYRRQAGLDTALPDQGVVITKTNERVAQGEGTVIVQESNTTAGVLSDAPFTLTAPRHVFNDLGSGVSLEVIAMNGTQAQVRLNYAVPPFENDVFVANHDDRWQTTDIWVDAPDAAGNFAANPRDVASANERPVINRLNKLIGRVRNFGAADATNFEVELEILEPWGTDGNWRQVKIDTVPLLQGQATNANADYLIVADWTPTSGVHTCVRLRARTVANDINPANNFTQENIHDFTTVSGSPYQPVVSDFQVRNPFPERLPIFFKVDGLPAGWTQTITPARPILGPNETITAQVRLQPHDAAPHCSDEQVTVTAYAPRVDTLKQIGAITLAVSLKFPATITHDSWGDCPCNCSGADNASPAKCNVVTRGCTNPKLPNTQIAVTYTKPDGTTAVKYVMTDANGCYADVFPVDGAGGAWQTSVSLEPTACRDGAASGPIRVRVPPATSDSRCPDLVVASMKRPVFDSKTRGSVITAVIRNVGKGPATPTLARLVDPSTTQPTGAPFNDVVQVPALAPGQSYRVTFRLPYWVFNPDAELDITADYKGELEECKEDNNKREYRAIG
jgi:hypothetical protein